MPNEPQKFWNFSLDLYNREGVASACLALQDRYQLDVNLLLLCFWYGTAQGKMDSALLTNAISFSKEWLTQVVQPLRDSRTWMKHQGYTDDQFHRLREEIKANELTAEKIQQERLAELASQFSVDVEAVTGKDAIDYNIARLLSQLKVENDRILIEMLKVIHSALET